MSNQNLFNLMFEEHGLTLLESEMEDIKAAIRKDEAVDEEAREPAEWVDIACPKCENGGMVARDKFGLFCVVSGYGWRD